MRKVAAWMGYVAVVMAIGGPAQAQPQTQMQSDSLSPGFINREEVLHYSPEWTGERFADGRPKVADAILDRMQFRDARGSMGDVTIAPGSTINMRMAG